MLVACTRTPISGKWAFIVTSEAQENQLGAQAYQQVLRKERQSSDAHLTAVVQRVGGRIAAVANKPTFQWEFRLLESTERNAFCLPGGKVAVYTGILPIARNEAGLAAVLGHEVAHAIARHAGQRITLLLGTQLGFEGLRLLLGSPPSRQRDLLFAALGLGANVGLVLPFSRSNEAEADQIGLVYSAQAGYDPREAPALWQRMASSAERGSIPTFLSSHPSNESRERELRNQLPKVAPLYEKSPRHGLGETFYLD